MFKALIAATVMSAAITVPSLSFAQDNGEVSRSAVKSDLVQMEQSGYNPQEDRATYPQQAQASERRVEDQRGVEAASYGPSSSGTSGSGMRNPTVSSDPHAVFFGH